MTQQHTPGPWALDDATTSSGRAILAGGRIIAVVKHTPAPDAIASRCDPDALLMVAAPVLLAVCRDALEVECDMAEAPDSELAKRLRAAIALATGEEPKA